MTHHTDPRLSRVVQWLGVDLPPIVYERLRVYAEWLVDEALPAGGIGPHEADRVVERHVADALTFAKPMRRPIQGRLVDLGSGVGLPGIPLAVAFPELEVLLVDRRGRRIDLASRAVRVLGIDNVTATASQVDAVMPGWDYVTMRAVFPPAEAIPEIRRLLAPTGLGVLGLSRSGSDDGWEHLGIGVEIVHVPSDVLDSPGSLLTIRP